MAIGTGIFLSSVLFVLAMLYTKRKGNWSMKQVFRTVVSIISFVTILAALTYWHYINPKQISELNGVKLGETLRDLEFKHGKLIQSKNGDYSIDDKGITVRLNNNKVSDIFLYCNEMWSSLDGISCGSDSEKILKKYGRHARVDCFPDNNESRRFFIKKYSRVYLLNRNRVIAFGIYSDSNIEYEEGERC